MKHILLTTIAAVVLVGCGESDDIWTAAEEGNVEAVKGYLAIGINVDERDESYGGTPLHWAAFRGRNEVAEFLIAEGADVNAKNKADDTPLDKAIEKNRDDTVSLLREHGGKATKESKPAEPFFETVKPEPPTAKAPDISIHKAAEEGNIEAVKQHLAAGTDVNIQDFDGWTPLHWAAMEGHKKTAELLIANGADVDLKDNLGWTALLITDHMKIAELLISNGADVNLKNMDGNTPLQYAAMAGQIGIAKLLLIKEADLNTKNINGKRPLDVAIQLNHPEIADLLRKHGGKTTKELKAAEPVSEAVKPETTTAKTPDISIHHAAKTGNIEAVKQILNDGTDVELKCVNCGGTVLGHAAYGGQKEITKLLIAMGADVNTKNKDSTTPLHQASLGGHKEVAELLIGKGADVNAKVVSGTKQGLTPLDAANARNKPETADLLRKHGGKTGAELKAEGK